MSCAPLGTIRYELTIDEARLIAGVLYDANNGEEPEVEYLASLLRHGAAREALRVRNALDEHALCLVDDDPYDQDLDNYAREAADAADAAS